MKKLLCWLGRHVWFSWHRPHDWSIHRSCLRKCGTVDQHWSRKMKRWVTSTPEQIRPARADVLPWIED